MGTLAVGGFAPTVRVMNVSSRLSAAEVTSALLTPRRPTASLAGVVAGERVRLARVLDVPGYEVAVPAGFGERSATLARVGLSGHGNTVRDALEDLLDEAADYAGQWRDFLHVSPVHAPHADWVGRVLAAGEDLDELARVVLGRPVFDPAAVEGAVVSGAGLVSLPGLPAELLAGVRAGAHVLVAVDGGVVPARVVSLRDGTLLLRVTR